MKAIRKLSLDADALRVETFSTHDDPTPRTGTVHAHAEASHPTHCGTCPPQWSCYNTCYCPSWSGAECNTVCIG